MFFAHLQCNETEIQRFLRRTAKVRLKFAFSVSKIKEACLILRHLSLCLLFTDVEQLP